MIKTIKMFMCILIITSPIKLFSQEEKHSIQINIVDYLQIIGFPNYKIMFEYQYALSGFFNISISPHFQYNRMNDFVKEFSGPYTGIIYHNPQVREKFNNDIYEFGMKSGILFRPSGRWLRGMYFAVFIDPMLVYRSLENQKFFGIGNHFEMGYQWVFKNGFTLSLGGGYFSTFYFPLFESEYKYLREIYGDSMGIFPTSLRISIGYSLFGGKK